MVLNPHGIELTFLKLDSWSKKTLSITKIFDTFSKNGFNPVLSSIPMVIVKIKCYKRINYFILLLPFNFIVGVFC